MSGPSGLAAARRVPSGSSKLRAVSPLPSLGSFHAGGSVLGCSWAEKRGVGVRAAVAPGDTGASGKGAISAFWA